MKSILASLVSFFMAATLSDSASGFHVSAAVIHTPISATTVKGMTVRAVYPDDTVNIPPSVRTPNGTNPADI
ncbi:hypothetical protein Daus18300_011672 [Diaporthe australafricana]|uniref:Uncharacterized protein n=1 Tax=Diaporthe australafricana TaxID=127596 RepID=A0ABR3W5N4_9PEZI